MNARLGGAVAGVGVLLLFPFLLLLAPATFQTEQPAAGACPAPAASFGSGAIDWPMPAGSYRLTSGYGPRWGAFHDGIDMAAPIGTPIYAAHDMTIAEAGPASGFGLWVVGDGALPDGTRFSTVYGHIDSYSVQPGQTVSAGQQIATVGNRGQSTGPHLHFEVWPGGRLDGGSTTDPAGWLNANATPGAAPAADPVQPAAEVDPGSGTLTGPVPPQGTQSSFTLTAEQQSNVESIVAAAKGALTDDPATPINEPLRAAVIAVATASQESTLRVIDYGDAAGPDSKGLFQQRDPWGSREERLDPVQSTRFFLLGGSTAPDGYEERGLTDFADWNSIALTEAAAQVQLPRRDLRGHYAKWEEQAIRLVAASAGVDPATTGLGATPSACYPTAA